MSQTLLFVQVINLSGSRIVILCAKMTRVWGRKKIIWVSFCTQQVSCDWQSSSQNYSSQNNPNSRVSFAAEAVLMTCLTAACWSLESALTCRAVNREMRGSIEIKPSLCRQRRVRGSEGFVEREGERRVGGSGADRGSRGDDSIPSGSTKGCWRDLTGWAQGTEAGGNQANGMNKKGEVEKEGWPSSLWRGEPTVPFLAGYHTPQPACSPVCSCSLLTKCLCLPHKGDQFHSIQSPADITFKIKCCFLMKKQSQDTECLSMPHWYPAIRNVEILVWLQSPYTSAHVQNPSVLELPINSLLHTASTHVSVTKAKGKGLEVSDPYVHALKCWQCQKASFDGDDN